MHEQLKLNNQLCFRLYTAARLVVQSYYPYLSPLGLTYPQYLVMLVLWEQDNLPSGDIAQKLHLDFNTLTPILQRMQREGFISRKRNRQDARQRIVSLTEAGKALEQQAKYIPDCLSKTMVQYGADPDLLSMLIDPLDNLITILQNTSK